MIKISPVILCGGSGTRLWPLSRSSFPKQFISFDGKNSLFQNSIKRIKNLECQEIVVSPLLVVTNEEHRFIVSDQLKQIDVKSMNIILEPVSKNTAPALTTAAFEATRNNEDPILVVLPADHSILDNFEFSIALKNAILAASDGSVIILGSIPTKPELGYGYIKTSEKKGPLGEHQVLEFKEKPSLNQALEYLSDGGYLWNSGILVIRASQWLLLLEKFRSDIYKATKKSWLNGKKDLDFMRPDPDNFSLIPSESIDYAVLEKCPISNIDIKVLPLNVGWSDLGSWDSLNSSKSQDDLGNVKLGDVISINSKNSFIFSTDRLIAAVGVDNLIIVETPDALLVASKSHSQNINQIVYELKRISREEYMNHRKVYRPWGWYDLIDQGIGFKVKRILVNPNSSLSLQTHAHRAEHWVVISGSAKVTKGMISFTLNQNQSIYIPQGEVHSIENLENIPLEIIEVQTGAYLDESDIVRISDPYKRP